MQQKETKHLEGKNDVNTTTQKENRDSRSEGSGT